MHSDGLQLRLLVPHLQLRWQQILLDDFDGGGSVHKLFERGTREAITPPQEVRVHFLVLIDAPRHIRRRLRQPYVLQPAFTGGRRKLYFETALHLVVFLALIHLVDQGEPDTTAARGQLMQLSRVLRLLRIVNDDGALSLPHQIVIVDALSILGGYLWLLFYLAVHT